MITHPWPVHLAGYAPTSTEDWDVKTTYNVNIYGWVCRRRVRHHIT